MKSSHMFLKLLESKCFLVILVACLLILAPSSYAGASYYQSNKLIVEANKLVETGDYTGAISKYDQSLKKWKWNNKKIAPKKDNANKFQAQAKKVVEGEGYFGTGEWQKCMDSLTKIEEDFPKYSQAQNRYSDCQRKLEEQNSALAVTKAAVVAKNLATESAASPGSNTKKSATSRTVSVYTNQNSGAIDNCTYTTPVGRGEYYDSICISGSDAFRQKVKEGLGYLRNKSSDHYGLMRNHTGKIGQNLVDGGACQGTYDQFYAGFYSAACTYCSSSGGKGLIILDSIINNWSNSDVAGVILHEALHSMPGMCLTSLTAEALNSVHAQMRQNWEDVYDSL